MKRRVFGAVLSVLLRSIQLLVPLHFPDDSPQLELLEYGRMMRGEPLQGSFSWHKKYFDFAVPVLNSESACLNTNNSQGV